MTDTQEWLTRLRRVPVNGGFTVNKPWEESELQFIARLCTYARFLHKDLQWSRESGGKYFFRVTEHES